METILFSFILVLIIIWMMLGILYFYMRYVFRSVEQPKTIRNIQT